MKSLVEKINSIANREIIVKSAYIQANETSIVRISDHMPRAFNFEVYNEGVENVFLVFVTSEFCTFTENDVETLINNDSELSKYNVNFSIVDSNEGMDDFSIEMLRRNINN